MLRKWMKLFLLLCWMVLIFSFSMESGAISREKSNSLTIWISERLVRKDLSLEEKEKYIEKYDFYIRKAAHLGIYFILGLLTMSTFLEFDLKRTLFYAILFVFLYACSDEIHQLFVNERSGQIQDVFLDTLGATLGIILYHIVNQYLVLRKKHIIQ